MNYKNKGISLIPVLIIFFIILLTNNCLATIVHVETIKNNIANKEFAEFLVKIENNDNITKQYSLDFGIQPQWSIITQPFYTLTLKPKEVGNFHVFIKAKNEIPPDHYALPFYVKTKNESIKRFLYINYGNIDTSGQRYQPTIKMAITIEPSYNIDPRKTFSFKVLLNNYNILNLSDLKIIILGAGLHIEKNISLGPLETRKIYYITAKLDNYTTPGKKRITLAIEKNGKIIEALDNLEINVIAYNQTIIKKNIHKKYLIIKKNITILNKGNHPIDFIYKIPTNYFKNLFIKADPKPYIIKENKKLFLAWDIKLKPKQTISIIITENYLSLVVILILLILSIVIYFVMRSPIVIEKKVEIIKNEEGTTLTTKLFIKNRSTKPIEKIVIKELVPPILHVKVVKQIGILEPSRIIRHEKKGTLLEWKIESLEPLEERIIIYKTITKISIIGEIILKPTLVKYLIKNKWKITKSNAVITRI